jgi:hypothetical protein
MSTKIITVSASPPSESSGSDYYKGAPLNAVEFDQNLINLRAAVDRRALVSSSNAFACGALTATTINGTTITGVGVTSIFNSGSVDNTTNTYLNLIKNSSKAWSIGNVLHSSSRDFTITDDQNGGGTARLCINEAGNVLIGTVTASTGAKLEVAGSMSCTGVFSTLGGSALGITIRSNGIQTEEYNGTDAITLNYKGYLNGTTQYRSLNIYDGKTNRIAEFNSTGLAVTGSISATGDLDLGTGGILKCGSGAISGSATSAGNALPALAEGYLVVSISGVNKKIPYYGA